MIYFGRNNEHFQQINTIFVIIRVFFIFYINSLIKICFDLDNGAFMHRIEISHQI